MLQSLRGCKAWHFGPFYAGRTEMSHGTNWTFGIFVSRWFSVAIQFTRHP